MASFLAVTGPKHDLWLVRTVGLLIAIAGASLLTAARKGAAAPARDAGADTPDPGIGAATLVLAIGFALGLAAVDIRYTASGTIRPIYLADAVAEIGLAAALLWARLGRRLRP
jgi:hypothetical protein